MLPQARRACPETQAARRALAALAHGIESGGIIVLAIDSTRVAALEDDDEETRLDELVVDDGCWRTRHICLADTPHLLRSHCGSRRYANAIAEHQTLSIDDNSKSIELECPFGDQSMLKIIEPRQVQSHQATLHPHSGQA